MTGSGIHCEADMSPSRAPDAALLDRRAEVIWSDVLSSTVNGRPGEAALLERLRDGDEELFRAVVTELTPVLTRLARVYTSSGAASQDAIQDTWLTVLDKRHLRGTLIIQDFGVRDPCQQGTAQRRAGGPHPAVHQCVA